MRGRHILCRIACTHYSALLDGQIDDFNYFADIVSFES